MFCGAEGLFAVAGRDGCVLRCRGLAPGRRLGGCVLPGEGSPAVVGWVGCVVLGRGAALGRRSGRLRAAGLKARY